MNVKCHIQFGTYELLSKGELTKGIACKWSPFSNKH